MRDPVILHGRTVVPGSVEGEALVSHEPISGWGGIDPARGVIIERRHELYGVCFTGKILVFPSAKGSSGWSGFFQTTRLSGTAPIGMIIGRISAKSALGAVVDARPRGHRPRRRPVRGHRHRRLGASRQLNSGGHQAMTLRLNDKPGAGEDPRVSAAAESTGERPAGGVALAVTGLSVAYGNVVAVHDATFTVAEGDACAIIGPNGNGKSSILMGVTGMVRRRGEVDDLRRAGQERRRPVGGAARAHARA